MLSPFPSRESVAGGRHLVAEISGRDRVKFFKRPVLASSTSAAVGGFISPPKSEAFVSGDVPTPITRTYRSVLCQTDMRESETQTDPYGPEHSVTGNQHPEVLALTTLCFGSGLPACPSDLAQIDRLRRRRAMELSLPKGSDVATIRERVKKIAALETTEWQEREADLDRTDQERVARLAATLQQRDEEWEEATLRRVRQREESTMEEAARLRRRVEARHIKAVRVLAHLHRPLTEPSRKRDRIAEYAEFGPRGKAAEAYTGTEGFKKATLDVRPTWLENVQEIDILELTQAHQLALSCKKDCPLPAEVATGPLRSKYQQRIARHVRDDVDFAFDAICGRNQPTEATSSVQDLYRTTPRVVRPSTPTLVLEEDEVEAHEDALGLIQRLIRGRAAQNGFYAGKERCRGLIEELQAAENARVASDRDAQGMAPSAERRRQEQQAAVEDMLDAALGGFVASTLHFLTCEQTRQCEAAKFERLRQQAESIRHAREEAEQRRRAVEEAARVRDGKRFYQIRAVHAASAKAHLGGLFRLTVDAFAHRTAVAAQMAIMEVERGAGDSTDSREDQVCALMLGFVIPQVEKEVRKKLSEELLGQRAGAEAAHSVLVLALNAVVGPLPFL